MKNEFAFELLFHLARGAAARTWCIRELRGWIASAHSSIGVGAASQQIACTGVERRRAALGDFSFTFTFTFTLERVSGPRYLLAAGLAGALADLPLAAGAAAGGEAAGAAAARRAASS